MKFHFYYDDKTDLVSNYSEKKNKILCKNCINNYWEAVELSEKKKKLPPVKKDFCNHTPEIRLDITDEELEKLQKNYIPYIKNDTLILEASNF